MLARFFRLHRRQDIEQAVRYGTRVVTPYIAVYWRTSIAAAQPRIACIAGKRVHASAVRRHRAQRLLRALAKEIIPRLQSGVDMVWVGQPNLATVEGLDQLRASIQSYEPKLPLTSI
jgi:ribonuclease P protein component